ncbi:MAG: DNA strand exchange inhibitor protein [Gemmataceae bacterium]|nr:DNA strand exchange inhibitor protein [Planctomycetia bacterium]MBX3399667.1 DNA strand exchange inhibitor protein [Gemmataceae bacterium]
MDPHTLELLEFDKVRELLATYAASSLGRDLARQLEPSKDAATIRAEIALVTEMVDALVAGQAPPFGGLHDVRLLARRAAIGTALTAEQLLQVAETLTVTGAMYRYRMRLNERLAGLIELLSGVEDQGAVAKTIGGCIDGRGHVLDMASRELGIVRQKLYELDEKVKAEVRRLLRDPELRKILSYPNATVNGDHYVLPVAVNHRHKVEGIVHRVSGTGETVFVEPASIARLSADRVTLKAEEDREVKRILRRLSQEVGRVSKPLCWSIDLLAKLDLVTAKARFSRDFDMYPPSINTEGKLWLRDARHPLLQHIIRNEPRPDGAPPRAVVPIDLRLGLGFNLLVITGPNTGGKTVTLKTAGLLAVMAQCGLHLPANEGSTVPVFDQILSDIGDEQSLEQSLSTFSSHVTRIAHIFSVANERSLVLLDELGAGTDPVEGAALGRAILDQLDAIGARAIVTTHLGDLKTYAFHNERAENGAVEFDVETLRPTYRLHIGQYGMSNALKIARRLKLPKELLKRAHKYLKRRKGKTGELARLQELRAEAEKAKVDALAAQHEAERQKAEYERQALAVERERREAEVLNERRGRLKVHDRVHVARFDAVGKVVKVDAKKQVVSVSLGLGQWEVPFDEITPVDD